MPLFNILTQKNIYHAVYHLKDKEKFYKNQLKTENAQKLT